MLQAQDCGAARNWCWVVLFGTKVEAGETIVLHLVNELGVNDPANDCRQMMDPVFSVRVCRPNDGLLAQVIWRRALLAITQKGGHLT